MRTLVTLIALALGVMLGGAIVLYSGTYDIAATEPHFRPTYWALETGVRRSIRQHARGIEVPQLTDRAAIERGVVVYHAQCVQCHGAPGVAPEAFALGLTPPPANLAYTAREWPAAELYWVVKNGIRMTGMPAWQFRLPESDLWAVVAFMQQLPLLSPEQYAARVRAARDKPGVPMAETAGGAGDPARGKLALSQYACVTCHVIPGIVGAYTPVGPPLAGIATRRFIGGVLPNTAEHMVRWLRHPREVDPLTAMPDLGVTERDARDIAAYLYTLK